MTAIADGTPRPADAPDEGRAKLVVVGNGMSGARALEEILARGGGEQFAITVFGDEPYGNYNRILLSEVLANAAGEAVDNDDVEADDEDEIFLNPRSWYEDNGITLHVGVRIVRIDRHSKVVYGDDGSVTPYDTLILATGSRSFFPPMDGMWASDTELTPGVFGFRSLDDATSMLRHVRGRTTAVVIGGGLLGLEAAAGLQAHGLAVHVVHPTEVLMNQQLEAEASKVLRSKLEDMGMHMHLGVKTNEILVSDGAVVGRCASPTARRSRATPSSSPPASARTSGSRCCPASRPSAPSSSTTRCARSTTTTSSSSASAPSTAARSTASSGRCGSRPACSPTS